MKRMLVLPCMLLLAGFFMAGCEEEEHERHHYAYHGYHHGGYPHHGYHFTDDSLQNDGVLQVETAIEP